MNNDTNDMNELIRRWKQDRSGKTAPTAVDDLIKVANEKRKSMLGFQYGNIIVLTIVMIVLILFFIYLFPFQETLSHIGVALMIGGLFVRIALEIHNAIRFKAIRSDNSALETTNRTIAFYRLRKIIHGPVTLGIVALYTIGLGMLTPEFRKHVGDTIFVFDGLYVIAAIILIWQIGKGIRKEMKDLEDLIAIRKQME